MRPRRRGRSLLIRRPACAVGDRSGHADPAQALPVLREGHPAKPDDVQRGLRGAAGARGAHAQVVLARLVRGHRDDLAPGPALRAALGGAPVIGGRSVVCVGGTFNRLHVGHRALLQAAADVGDLVRVGVTTDPLVARARGPAAGVRPYRERAADVRRLCREIAPGRATVVPLSDALEPVRRPEFDAIVVSPETLPTAELINAKRRARGARALKIVVVPLVQAFDGRAISSTRVAAGEIDGEGHPARAGPATGRAGASTGAGGRYGARTGSRAGAPRGRAPPRRRSSSARARRASGRGRTRTSPRVRRRR